MSSAFRRCFGVSVLLLCIQLSLTGVSYEKALTNNKKLKKLFKEKFGDKGYSDDEIDERLPYFKENLQLVVDNNNNEDIGWTSVINFMADRTTEEKQEWLATVEYDTEYTLPEHEKGSNVVNKIDWEEKGYVGPVMSQTQDCRACWAFAAIVSIDGRYQILTNQSVYFSVQELVDCVYYVKGRDHDGCYGGQMADAFEYVETYGRLTTEDTLPYVHEAAEGCSYNELYSALTDAHIVGWELLEASDQQHIDTLLDGPISVAVQTTDNFLFYGSGVFRDDSCTTLYPNHAVAMVGYDENSFKIKNSWGTEWGVDGYMFAARGHHGCGLLYYSVFPIFSEGAPDVQPLIDPDDHCFDDWDSSFCQTYIAYCVYYSAWCQKTCGECT